MQILLQLIINSLVAAAIYALLAVGFNLIYGTTKFFNLAHGVMAALGGYLVFALIQKFSLGLPSWLAFLLAVAGSTLIGLGSYLFIYAPLKKRGASSMILLVASLGISTALQAVIAIIFSSQFYTLSDLVPERTFFIGGAAITGVQIALFITTAIISAATILLIRKTAFGRAVQAVSDDEEVAKIVGINTEKIIAWTFVLGSALAGIAGVFVGLDTGIEPNMGFHLLLRGIIAAIVGGIGTMWGALLGALLLGLVENFGIWYIASEWKDAIAFALLIIFLIFRPRGILKR